LRKRSVKQALEAKIIHSSFAEFYRRVNQELVHRITLDDTNISSKVRHPVFPASRGNKTNGNTLPRHLNSLAPHILSRDARLFSYGYLMREEVVM